MGFLNNGRMIVGYDLGNEFCQISFAVSGSSEIETLSQVAGAQAYNIPTVLCKRYGTNQWLYGREALRSAGEQEGILVENLLSMALVGELVVIEGESFDPVALLAIFFKRSLGLLPQAGTKLGAIMITCSSLDTRVVEVLTRVVEGSRLKAGRIAFQSYEESFYSYMIRQPRELWSHDAVLFHYRRGGIWSQRMESNRRTTPIVTFIEERKHPFPEYALPLRGEEDGERNLTPERQEELETAFFKIAREACEKGNVGSVFLIGDGFAGDWMKDSLRFLCRGRRVFQGNNLFSKGACCGMQERIEPSEMGSTHVFLGGDRLKSNIGMRVFRQGEESYCALLDAGANWYETEQEMEIYLQDGNELALQITPLVRSGADDRNGRLVRIVLEGLPGNIARLKTRFSMKEENRLAVEVRDLGFGGFRPSSGRVWKEEIEI